MKKIISLLLVVILTTSLTTGCGSQEAPSITEATQQATEETATIETQPTVETTEPTEPQNTLSVLNLDLTGAICDLANFEQYADLLLLDTFKHSENVENSYYSYLYQSLPQDCSTWDEIKNVKFADIQQDNIFNDTEVNAYNISLMKPDPTIGGFSISHMNCIFYISDPEMTVGEAYDSGLYAHGVFSEVNYDGYEYLIKTISDGQEDKHQLEIIIEQFGTPTNVYYTDFTKSEGTTKHITFDIVYDLGDKAIVFDGFEKFEDYETDEERIVIQGVAIYGTGSKVYERKTTIGDNRCSVLDP